MRLSRIGFACRWPARTALSSYEMFWYPWEEDEKGDVGPAHASKAVCDQYRTHPFSTYKYKMHQEDLAKQFGRWYRMEHDGKKTICLLGMRASESLQRYSGIVNKRYGYKGVCWITRQFKDVWMGTPLYDWTVNDIWHSHRQIWLSV